MREVVVVLVEMVPVVVVEMAREVLVLVLVLVMKVVMVVVKKHVVSIEDMRYKSKLTLYTFSSPVLHVVVVVACDRWVVDA